MVGGRSRRARRRPHRPRRPVAVRTHTQRMRSRRADASEQTRVRAADPPEACYSVVVRAPGWHDSHVLRHMMRRLRLHTTALCANSQVKYALVAR